MTASDRFDIRSEGSLTGDITAQRISVEEGAYFKGGIDIRKPGQKTNGDAKEASPTADASRTSSRARVKVPDWDILWLLEIGFGPVSTGPAILNDLALAADLVISGW